MLAMLLAEGESRWGKVSDGKVEKETFPKGTAQEIVSVSPLLESRISLKKKESSVI